MVESRWQSPCGTVCIRFSNAVCTKRSIHYLMRWWLRPKSKSAHFFKSERNGEALRCPDSFKPFSPTSVCKPCGIFLDKFPSIRGFCSIDNSSSLNLSVSIGNVFSNRTIKQDNVLADKCHAAAQAFECIFLDVDAANQTLPSSGLRKRGNILARVVLPQPDAPTNAVTLPCGTSRLMWFKLLRSASG